MQYSLKFIKKWFALFLVIFASCLVSNYLTYRSFATEASEYEQAGGVIKTVAHLNVKNPNLELLATFPDEDVAYYRWKTDARYAEVGDSVTTYRGEEATVTDVSVHGFTVECYYLSIGDSGTVIRNSDGEQIGYVSQQVGDALFYCIWA